jgi:hypothetical protein
VPPSPPAPLPEPELAPLEPVPLLPPPEPPPSSDWLPLELPPPLLELFPLLLPLADASPWDGDELELPLQCVRAIGPAEKRTAQQAR